MFKVIITGATGMVGEGVLHECLMHPDVEKVLIVNRRASGKLHPKLEEVLCPDFFDLRSIESKLTGYNACFFCLGVSSIGMKEEQYSKLTYELTANFASTLARLNRDMVFCYVSGAGTDSTEKGRSMWARVKGRTENALMTMPFKRAYMFRPGFIKPTPGLKNTLKVYKYINWMFPILKAIAPNSASTLKDIGLAMIHTVTKGYDKAVLEVRDIVKLAN